MAFQDDVRVGLLAAIEGIEPGISMANQLCHALVKFLDIDGAAITLTHDGAVQGTFGSSCELSRRLEELQFTLGEGPCLDAVHDGRPVLVADLADANEHRWPAYTDAVLSAGVHAVFALPVRVASDCVGALDLFANGAHPLTPDDLAGALFAAELATLPLHDLIRPASDPTAHDGQLADGSLSSLERIEVYQATGMIMGQLGIGAAEALVRLRAYSFAAGTTAGETAWRIVDGELSLELDTRRIG
jgi:hypothetical protein